LGEAESKQGLWPGTRLAGTNSHVWRASNRETQVSEARTATAAGTARLC